MGRTEDVFEELMIEQGMKPSLKENKEQDKHAKKAAKEEVKAAKLKAKEDK